MSETTLTVLVALGMAVGIAGVVVPVIPGLLLIGGSALVWALLTDAGPEAWLVFTLVLAVVVAGTVLKYVVPARSLAGAGAPRSTLLLGVVGAVVGFFAIPVVGLLVGFVLGVFLAELQRLQDRRPAWASTWVTLKGIGLGMLLELVAGLLAVMVWGAGAWLSRG